VTRLFVILALLLGASPSYALPGDMMLLGVSAPAAGATYTGVGDVVAFTVYYSCTWAYKATYAAATGKLCGITRASDSETCDLLAATTGGEGLTANCSGADNGKPLATFLTATTGTWTKAYNQVANGTLDLPASATQPTIVLNCLGSLTCVQVSANGVNFASTTNITPSNGQGTMLGYSNRVSGTGVSADVEDNAAGGLSELRRTTGTGNSCTLAGSSGTFNATCSDNAWHALLSGTGSGTNNSLISVDGTETPGTVTGNTSAGHVEVAIGANSTTFKWIEAGVIDGSVVNSTVRAALIANMQARN